MRALSAFALASFLIGAFPATAQDDAPSAEPARATYITKEEIDLVNASPGTDRNIRVVDIGHENFAVGVVRRSRTVNGVEVNRPPRAASQPDGPCGQTLESPPRDAVAGGITHDVQTEVYFILSGGGTMFTDGHLVNGRRFALADLNGPTCIGAAYGVSLNDVRPGDVVIIPAGVVHGWAEVPDHVVYLSFRPSPGILSAGWLHPALQTQTPGAE